MSYKCYRCHRELNDEQTKCEHCGAVKINVPKKEDIKKDEEVIEQNYIANSKFAPYLIALSITLNISFIVLAGVNYTNTNFFFYLLDLHY